MTSYTYDNNGIYTGITTDDPPPYFSTRIQPPPAIEGYYLCFSKVDNNWKQLKILALTNDDIIADLTKDIDSFYDKKAQEKRYTDRYTCSLRAGYSGPFQSEGLIFAQWMDQCNIIAYSIMEDVLTGKRPTPTIEDIITEFPTLLW